MSTQRQRVLYAGREEECEVEKGNVRERERERDSVRERRPHIQRGGVGGGGSQGAAPAGVACARAQTWSYMSTRLVHPCLLSLSNSFYYFGPLELKFRVFPKTLAQINTT